MWYILVGWWVLVVICGDFGCFWWFFGVFSHICCSYLSYLLSYLYHICHTFFWHIGNFYGTSKIFYTNLIHTRGQLWSEVWRTCRTFSGRKWLLKEKIAIFWHKYWFFEKFFFGRLCPREFLVISICHKIVLKAQFF